MSREKELKKELEAIEKAKFRAIYDEEAPKMRAKYEGKYFAFTYFNTDIFNQFIYIDWIDVGNSCISLTTKSLAFDCHGWSFEDKQTDHGANMFKVYPKKVFSSMDMDNAIPITEKKFKEEYNRMITKIINLK